MPLPYPAQLIGDYMPAALSHDDYPELVPEGQTVDTVAVGAVMIAVNWPKNSDRYRRVERFVDVFFSKIAEFQKPPHHPKWREVNLAATLPNWTRLAAAQEWLDSRRSEGARVSVVSEPATSAARPATPAPAAQSSSELFQDFLNWRRQQGGP